MDGTELKVCWEMDLCMISDMLKREAVGKRGGEGGDDGAGNERRAEDNHWRRSMSRGGGGRSGAEDGT